MPGLYTITNGRYVGSGEVFLYMATPRNRRHAPGAGDLARGRNLPGQMTNLQPEAGDYGQQLQLSRLRIIFQDTPQHRFVRRGAMDLSSRERISIIRQLFDI